MNLVPEYHFSKTFQWFACVKTPSSTRKGLLISWTRGIGSKEDFKMKRKNERNMPVSSGYEDTALETSDHCFLFLTLEHWRQVERVVQRSSQDSIQDSITPVVRILETLELTRCQGGLLHPLGHCTANKPSALIWPRYLTTVSWEKKVSIKNPWFLKTWLE